MAKAGKSDTVRWGNSLPGYVTTAVGEKLFFSLILNRRNSSLDRKWTDELEGIAVLPAGFTGRSVK